MRCKPRDVGNHVLVSLIVSQPNVIPRGVGIHMLVSLIICQLTVISPGRHGDPHACQSSSQSAECESKRRGSPYAVTHTHTHMVAISAIFGNRPDVPPLQFFFRFLFSPLELQFGMPPKRSASMMSESDADFDMLDSDDNNASKTPAAPPSALSERGEARRAGGARVKGKKSPPPGKRNGRKKSALPARGKKGGAKAGKGKKYCRGCGKFLPLSDFPLCHSLCFKDKRAVDNLTGFAKRQGQKKWFDEIQLVEHKLNKLLKNYHARCPEQPEGGKRGKFVIAEYREVY